MGFEAFQNSNSQFPIPLTLPNNGSSSSHDSDMAQPNGNLAYNVLTSSFQGRSSPFPRDMEQGSFYNTSIDPYMSLPMSFPVNNPMTEVQESENMGCPKRSRKAKSPACSRSDKGKMDTSRSMSTPSPKKSRLNVVSRENVPRQEMIEKLMMKEFNERNSQIIAMAEKYGVQNQLQRNSQIMPVLDGSICARRLKQYLFHMRNNASDNGIIYWKEFVSEYYAPGSRKRWCFCKYDNFQVQSAGVFYPRSMEVWSCDICGSRSGKGLEVKYDIFPRLLMTKFESGMRDEIMFLDSPCTRSVSCGLLLEYGKATVESVYQNYRVVHEGRLRIVFRHDLKILSWEFCAQKHEEFLLRGLIAPPVNQLVRVSRAFLSDEFSRASPEDLHTLCSAFASAGDQLARNMETPLVNDLGYPKRFIRCLQIAEVADSMKDVMALSLQTNMGPRDCWRIVKSKLNSNYQKEMQRTEVFTGPQSPPTGLLGPGFHAGLRQMFRGESSVSASVQSNSVTGARSVSVGRSVTVKEEQCSPERVPEACRSSGYGFVKREE